MRYEVELANRPGACRAGRSEVRPERPTNTHNTSQPRNPTGPVEEALLLALIATQSLLTAAVHIVALVVTLATLHGRGSALPPHPHV